MTQAAEHAQKAAAASLKDAVRELNRYKEKPPLNKRLLQKKLEKVLNYKDDLVEKHYMFAEKSGSDLDSTDMLDWLTPKLDEATDITDEVEILIEDLESNEDAAQKDRDEEELQRGLRNEINVAQLQCQTNETTLKDRVDLMMDIVNDQTKTTIEDANLIRSHMKQVSDSLEEMNKSWNVIKALSSIPDADFESIFQDEGRLKKLVADSCLLATAALNNRPRDYSSTTAFLLRWEHPQ